MPPALSLGCPCQQLKNPFFEGGRGRRYHPNAASCSKRRAQGTASPCPTGERSPTTGIKVALGRPPVPAVLMLTREGFLATLGPEG